MDQTRVIEVKKNILAANDEAAAAFRAERAQEGTFFVDVMASPGAGKTTLLLALIRELRARGVEALGVIEADLESDVDALKIKEAGVASVEPVSYTHLDVYKRQPVICCNFEVVRRPRT